MAAAPTPASPDVSSGNSSILSVRVVPSQDKAPEAGSAGAESHLPEQSSRVPRRRFACVLGAAALVVSTTIGLVTAAIAEAEVAASVDEAFEAQVDVSQAALDAALSAALHDTTMLAATLRFVRSEDAPAMFGPTARRALSEYVDVASQHVSGSFAAAWEFVPHVRDDEQRQAWEADTSEWIGEHKAFTFRADNGSLAQLPPNSCPCFPVGMVEPLAGNGAAVLFDLGTSPSRMAAMLSALSSASVALSAPVNLIQGSVGVLLFAPVFNAVPPSSDREPTGVGPDISDNVDGFALVVLKAEELLRNALLVDLSKLHVTVVDAAVDDLLIFQSDSAGPIVDTGPIGSGSIGAGREATRRITIGGRSWRVDYVEQSSFASDEQELSPLLFGLAAFFVSLGVVATCSVATWAQIRHAATLRLQIRAMRDYVAMSAHDLRTPVNAFQMAINLLRKTPLSEAQATLVNDQELAREVLSGIVDNVLTLERLSTGNVDQLKPTAEHIDVLRIVHRVVRVVSAYHGKDGVSIEVSADCHQETPESDEQRPATASFLRVVSPRQAHDTEDGDEAGLARLFVHTDGKWIQAMLLNFVSNAFKFTDSGSISISVSIIQPGGAHDTPTHRKHPRLRIAVADTGKGVPDAAKARLFGRFVQLQNDAGGMGLGLFAVRTQAEILGGHAGVMDRPDGASGAVFYFEIPVEHCPSTCPSNGFRARSLSSALSGELFGQVNEKPLAGYRVAIADDVRIALRLLKQLLETKGCSCDTAANGAELVQLVTRSAADYDFILSDLQMPVLDGCGASRRIREWEGRGGRNRLPIIIATASPSGEVQAQCTAAGADAVLPKPFEFSHLLQQLDLLEVVRPGAAATLRLSATAE